MYRNGKNEMKKVSCVMTTYRRFSCVERSISMFISQMYENKELIIYNTDIEYPLYLDKSISKYDNIKIINNNIDLETKHPYKNVGAIRRDARLFADGTYYITWDDDDIFFPWNISQCMDGIVRTNKLAWKPYLSIMKQRGYSPSLKFNYFEASVLVSMEAVEQHGYNLDKTGGEHMKWFKKLKEINELIEDKESIPAYCFYWADTPEIGGHKQSARSEYDRLDNFERHKLMTTDYAKKSLAYKDFLKDYKDIWSEFKILFDDIKITSPNLYDKYMASIIQEVFSPKN
jgi:glycosyltransferase involved in cell wall biosynthesis